MLTRWVRYFATQFPACRATTLLTRLGAGSQLAPAAVGVRSLPTFTWRSSCFLPLL